MSLFWRERVKNLLVIHVFHSNFAIVVLTFPDLENEGVTKTFFLTVRLMHQSRSNRIFLNGLSFILREGRERGRREELGERNTR